MSRPSAAPRRLAAAVACLCAAACAPAAGGGAPEPPAPEPPAPALPAAPWSGARLPAAAVPAVYRAQWARAENRASCALVAPRALGDGEGATPRAATFVGGWAVAYDRPGLRSAFGVAGTGSPLSGHTYDDWPFHVRWADGSVAGYGPEGGTGPNQLAFLRIDGQECLYNVWSRLGRAHLERLLAELRFVE